jgi:hypothetical protein
MPLIALLSFPAISGTNTFLCNKQVSNEKLCQSADKIKFIINKDKFSGNMTSVLHKKIYIESAVLINKKLRLNTVFSKYITAKKMASKQFKKKILQKAFKKICSRGGLYRSYIENNGSVLLKFSYDNSSEANLPKDMYIRSCQKQPNLYI